MTYLVKALVACRAPVEFDQDVDWAANEIREVDDVLYSRFLNNPAAFTVLAGPGLAANLTAGLAALSSSAAGTPNGATVSAVEGGSGLVHQTVLTLAATPITVRDTEQGGGVKIYDFPEGRILLLGAVATLAVKTTSVLASTLHASSTCQIGVGTVTQANATLATTEQNLIQNTAFTSSATVNVAATAVNGVGVLAAIDGTGTALDAYLNVAVAGATDIDANATVTVSGTVKLTWILLGDY